MHGHNYKADIYVVADELDEVGRVIDFADIKERFKKWIDDNWDHGFVLAEFDENAIKAIKQIEPCKLFLIADNPTAENMAKYLLENVAPRITPDLKRGVRIEKIVLWETDSSFAEVKVESEAPPSFYPSEHRATSI